MRKLPAECATLPSKGGFNMRARILATAVACTCVHVAHGASPPPAEAYGRLPAIGSAALSPDGKRIAVEVGYEYRATEPDRALFEVPD